MRTHRTQSYSMLCLLVALSSEACLTSSETVGDTSSDHNVAIAKNQHALVSNATSQPTATQAQVADTDPPPPPPPPTEEERRARMEIARETVGELDQARQREYRRAEKAALRAVLPDKRAALSDAQANRPTRQSPERDALDAKIATMRANIDNQSKKLQDLEALPD